MRVTLERWAYSKYGVFGTLRVGDLELYTVERPWKNNVPRESAIPVGEYALKLGVYNRGGYPAYELLDVPNRSLIKIHRANTYTDLLGCIGVGVDTGYIDQKWAIVNSTKALELFMGKMDGVETGIIEIFNTDSLSE